MSGFEVLKTGPYSTIQDLGRYGYAHLGVSTSGAMDEYAYRWTQKLLDNRDANAIELLLSGLRLKATQETDIAVCGADLGFHINGKKAAIWCTHHIYKGDILSFEKQYNGLRAYLAVRGGFKLEPIQGSYAYSSKEHKGCKLEVGMHLDFDETKQKTLRRVPKAFIPKYTKALSLRILLRPHVIEEILTESYTLSTQISSMGYKLEGKQMQITSKEMISEGIAFGGVQVPPDGQPIILLKERQSIGGYPNIGTVLAKDCFALAQLPIGAQVTFQAISSEDSQEEMKSFYRLFD